MKRLSLMRSELTRWLRSDKQMLLAVTLIYSTAYILLPLREIAAGFHEPLNLFEGFLTLLGNGLSMMVVVLVYLFLIIDYPDLTGNALFAIARLGRKRWLRNQLAFVYLTAAVYLLAIFLYSLLLTGGISFIANGWSNTMRKLLAEENAELRTQNTLAVLHESIQNYYRPYEAMWKSTLLMFLQIAFFGQLQICLTVRFNKLVAVFVNLLLVSAGALLWNAQHSLRWLFPISHATVGWHHAAFFNSELFPLWGSALYLVAGNLLLLFFSGYFARHCDFMLGRN